MMNIEEQISAFMDRALSPQEETELLHVLAVSPEKRDLLRSYNSLHVAAMNDIRSTTVPSSIDQNIFASVATHEAAAISTVGSATSTGLFTLGRGVLLTLGTIFLFTLGYFTRDFFSEKISQSVVSGKQIQQPVNQINLSDWTSGNGRSLSSMSGNSARGRERIVYQSVEKPMYITKTDTIFKEGKTIARVDTVFVMNPATASITENKFNNQKGITTDLSQLTSLPSYNFLERIDITLEREHLQTYPYIDYSKLNTTRMNQLLSIEAAYRFNQYHAIGIAFGEKTFSQDFYKVENDSIYIIQQQPTFTYGGAFYRFSYPLFRNVIPQAYFQVGSTKVGPVLGAKIAIAVSPMNHLNLLFGGNSSLLIYKLNQNIFTSYTLGLFYGIQYQF